MHDETVLIELVAPYPFLFGTKSSQQLTVNITINSDCRREANGEKVPSENHFSETGYSDTVLSKNKIPDLSNGQEFYAWSKAIQMQEKEMMDISYDRKNIMTKVFEYLKKKKLERKTEKCLGL